MKSHTALKWGLLAAAAVLVMQDRGSRRIVEMFFSSCDRYRREDEAKRTNTLHDKE